MGDDDSSGGTDDAAPVRGLKGHKGDFFTRARPRVTPVFPRPWWVPAQIASGFEAGGFRVFKNTHFMIAI